MFFVEIDYHIPWNLLDLAHSERPIQSTAFYLRVHTRRSTICQLTQCQRHFLSVYFDKSREVSFSNYNMKLSNVSTLKCSDNIYRLVLVVHNVFVSHMTCSSGSMYFYQNSFLSPFRKLIIKRPTTSNEVCTSSINCGSSTLNVVKNSYTVKMSNLTRCLTFDFLHNGTATVQVVKNHSKIARRCQQ